MAESKKIPYLVTYDIRLPKRLGRVFRFLKKRGLHVQYSVFLLELNGAELKRLTASLEHLTAPEDDVRIYPMPVNPEWTSYGKRTPVDGMILSGALGFIGKKND